MAIAISSIIVVSFSIASIFSSFWSDTGILKLPVIIRSFSSLEGLAGSGATAVDKGAGAVLVNTLSIPDWKFFLLIAYLFSLLIISSHTLA